MAKFSYEAVNNKGESSRGTLDAAHKNDVVRQLAARGLFMVSCKQEDAPAANGGGALIPTIQPVRPKAMQPPSPVRSKPNAQVDNGNGQVPSFHQWWQTFSKKETTDGRGVKKPKGKVTLKELVVLTRQLAISIQAGMSFVEALQGMTQNNKNPVLAWTLRNVLESVLSGKKFSEALARCPEIFEPFYVSMAAAGEAGGFIPDALNRIAEFLEKEMELRSKVKSAMIYPMVIGIVATLVITGMMAYIVPTFVRVFKEMGAPLPAPTLALIYVSDFTRKGGFLCPLVVVFLKIGATRLKDRNEAFRVFYDDKVLRMPLFGKIATLEIITRFIRTLASLAENGVAILLALSVARQVVQNRTIEKIVDEIYASVQQGNGISPVLYKSPQFPVLVANMVATGEKTGTIPEVLTKMANYYDAEVATAVRDLLTLMEPLLIVVMACIVGFVVAGLMLPTITMSSLVQG